MLCRKTTWVVNISSLPPSSALGFCDGAFTSLCHPLPTPVTPLSWWFDSFTWYPLSTPSHLTPCSCHATRCFGYLVQCKWTTSWPTTRCTLPRKMLIWSVCAWKGHGSYSHRVLSVACLYLSVSSWTHCKGKRVNCLGRKRRDWDIRFKWQASKELFPLLLFAV